LIGYSLSPFYLPLLSQWEDGIVKELPKFNNTSQNASMFITNYLQVCQQDSRLHQENNAWSIGDHPFLAFRLAWRFAHNIHPLRLYLENSSWPEGN
jgi:hypothetical protein